METRVIVKILLAIVSAPIIIIIGGLLCWIYLIVDEIDQIDEIGDIYKGWRKLYKTGIHKEDRDGKFSMGKSD